MLCHQIHFLAKKNPFIIFLLQSRSNLTVYAILHALYVGIVIYVVFIRTIISMSMLREVYKVMDEPGLFPASLGKMV